MNLLIRKATLNDLDAVSDLEKEIFAQTFFMDYQDTFLKNQTVLLAFDNDQLVGLLGWFEQDDVAEIIMVGVDANYRRMAIGSMLVKACISMLISKRVERLFIEVRMSNHAAITLYESLGFKINRKRIDYYKKPKEDALEMRLDL